MVPLSLRAWLKPPRHLLALFVVVIVVPAVALAWLAARTVEQDGALARQRVQDRLDGAASRIALELARRLDEAAHALADPADEALPGDSAIVTVTRDAVTQRPAGRLVYLPFVPQGDRARPGPLETAEAMEWRARDYSGAARAYRQLADRSASLADRAAALLGLARSLRKGGSAREALAVYDELAQLGALRIDGVPADLIARHARCATLAELRSPELGAQASAVFAGLRQRRWTLDRAWYELYTSETLAWLPPGAARDLPDAAAFALADAADEVVRLHREQSPGTAAPATGRRTLWLRDRPVLLLWQRTPERTTALIAGPAWVQSLASVWARQRVIVSLIDAESHAVLGEPGARRPGSSPAVAAESDPLTSVVRLSPGEPVVVRPASETGLPWTLRVASADAAGELAASAGQQRIVFGGLGVIAILVVVGGFVVARAAFRELEVARLQREFVAAVSHEFRSPLTSMKHLVEMLDEDAVPSEDRRRLYYRVLAQETNRLQRLVEDLLDFQRMEAGRAVYTMAPLDTAELVESVATAFAAQHGAVDRVVARVARRGVMVRAGL
jgi:hypothetical protein